MRAIQKLVLWSLLAVNMLQHFKCDRKADATAFKDFRILTNSGFVTVYVISRHQLQIPST